MTEFEDEDHTSFIRVERTDGEDVVLSNAALTLSVAGLSQSVRDETPGFISDEYLGAIAAESDLTAMELVTAGEWDRVQGGYRVVDPAVQAFAEQLLKRQLEFDEWELDPEDCAEHELGPNTHGQCRHCGTPMSL